jgi:hypothetical protein
MDEMDEDQLIYEVSVLLRKVQDSEDLVERAQAFYDEFSHQWSEGVSAYFQDYLERKKDQIDYEWYRVGRMGDAIAGGRNYKWVDI